jgi:flagellin-like protein
MGKMKANRKFIKGEKAVSAVIGVILMVAITVAIAATVYVYVSGMIGTSPQVTPNIQFSKNDVANTLLVSSADPTSLKWSDVERVSGTLKTGATMPTGTILAGDTVSVTSAVTTVTLRYKPTNTLLGTWTFTG